MRRSRLIMDVGMHAGKDTAYYLAKGFRVVGIEARPDFVEANRKTFAQAIAAGELVIEHCAIAGHEGLTPFWIFPDKDEWGTLDRRYAERNIARGLAHRIVEVPSRPFVRLLERHGVPYYLKVDIEGADLLCVAALAQFDERPLYVSLELTLTGFDAAFEAVAQLYALGYRGFKVVNQALNPCRRSPDPPLEGAFTPLEFEMGMTGPFGEETPGEWMPAAAVIQKLHRLLRLERLFAPEGTWTRLGWLYNGIARLPAQRHALRKWRAALTTGSWYDLHARLGRGEPTAGVDG